MARRRKEPKLSDLSREDQDFVRKVAELGSIGITQSPDLVGDIAWFLEFGWAPGTQFNGMRGDREPQCTLTEYGKKFFSEQGE